MIKRKKFGEASTPEEKELEHALRANEFWHTQNIEYVVVSGGISNSNWRVFVPDDERTYFLKIPGKGTEHFIDRVAAHDASVRAFEAGVGPEVIYFDAESGIEVIEFIDGLRTSTNGDFLNRDVRLNAGRALRKFNNSKSLKLQKTLMDMINEHLDQALKLGSHFPQDFSKLNAKYRQANKALQASGLDLVPCMNDTLAGNFLLDKDNHVTLVDFEYASNNDRCAELAVWFGEMFFAPETEIEIVEEYFGRAEQKILSRITVFKALADLKWATWAMVQNKLSSLDFDYCKYGLWKHMRARTVMYNPEWENWLLQV